jgi:hypothetical protein
VKQKHVIVRNTGENHVERIQGTVLPEMALYYIKNGKETYRSFQKETETVNRG